jgi:hypothetical protein
MTAITPKITTGSRHRVRHVSTTSAATRVALLIACPLGKLSPENGVGDVHRSGLGRSKSALSRPFSDAPSIMTAKMAASGQRRRTASAPVTAMAVVTPVPPRGASTRMAVWRMR